MQALYSALVESSLRTQLAFPESCFPRISSTNLATSLQDFVLRFGISKTGGLIAVADR
jgi:hypothetical protein